jgi:hypothetical protein
LSTTLCSAHIVALTTAQAGALTTAQVAALMLDAFPFQKHGTLEAKVRTLSEDAFRRDNMTPGQGTAACYLSRIAFGKSTLKKMAPHARLLNTIWRESITKLPTDMGRPIAAMNASVAALKPGSNSSFCSNTFRKKLPMSGCGLDVNTSVSAGAAPMKSITA